MTETLRKRMLIATMCSNWQQVAEEFDFGLESDHFCQAENMDGEKGRSAKAELAGLVKKYNVKVLHAPFNELHPAAIDPKARALAMERLNQAASIAMESGINKMVVHSGYMPFVYFKEWHRDRSVEFWQEFMDDKPEDFEICIENVLDDSPTMLTEIARKVGDRRVGLCLDAGHANVVCNRISGPNQDEWLEVMAPYLKHLHIHNNDGTGDFHDEIMKGTIDVDRMLKGVSDKCSSDTTITLEILNCDRTIDWLKKRLK